MRRLRPVIIGAGLAVFGLGLLALSGVLNVAASVQPYALTEWLWHIGVRQSVTLRSLFVEVPPLADPAMARRAAGHYDLVCATCHGAPDRPADAFARHLLPRPPPLVGQMDHWRPPARVYWTVENGIRHTAMPAWPTQRREDEVWDMVAFLRVLPELTPEAYRALSGQDAPDACFRCHGAAGEGGGAGLPRLDIQSPAYLAASLRAYRDGTRASGIMQSVAAGLDDDAVAQLATRLGRGPVAGPAADGGGGGAGAGIALHGIPDRKVASCQSCHGAAARPDYPRLDGQDAAYLVRQLHLFRELGAGRGGPHAEIMARVAAGLSDADIAAVAAW
ncbi:MAG: c-type cytochrome, partial [Rhizobiales bacterium]|nr:c-type cytochrome [Hyphomicrobiales bacterium]